MRISTSATYFPKAEEFVPLEFMTGEHSVGVNTDIVLNKKEKWLGICATVYPGNGSLFLSESADLTSAQLRSISRETLEQLGAKLQAACMDELSHSNGLGWGDERVERFCQSGIVRQICAAVLGGDLHWLEADSADA